MTDYSRQSFLGAKSPSILHNATIGLIGYGGGGSHIGQQLAHVGIGHFVIADDDEIEASNLNRLVGGTVADIDNACPKVSIAERLIKSVNPDAQVEAIKVRWQAATERLAVCDIVIGAVDSFVEREALERFCRRNLIPYIDIGMDVIDIGDEAYHVIGQIIQSLPGGPCMRCCNFITDEKLKREAETYGDAGVMPQVIWPNGVLASTAVGFAVQLLCPWNEQTGSLRYLAYDGSLGTLTVPKLVGFLSDEGCPHHPITELGDPLCDIRYFDQASFTTPKNDGNFAHSQTIFRKVWRWLVGKPFG